MFSRIRIALGVALAASLILFITAFAKGGFSFIAITGPNLKEEVRSREAALTEDYFTFADFYRNKTEAPADPGAGYEITRYYIDGAREIAFDRLHYYPESGFVYYDGIVNGSSEYDGEWYTASSEIHSIFEHALSISSIKSTDSIPSTAFTMRTQSGVSIPLFQLVLFIAAGVTVILLFASRIRKVLAHKL
jgi:hypothetical protein